MKTNQKITAVVLLSSLFLLGACGKKENKDTSSNTSVKSSKVAKAKADTSESTTSLSETETTSLQAETTSVASLATENQTDGQTAPQANSTIDITALVNNDFSSIAGSWSNDLGETITIAADGQVTSTERTVPHKIVSGETHDNIFSAGIGDPNQLVGGAAFIVIPAGIPNPHFGDTTQADRILIGQSEDADKHPFTRN